jgi:trimethylamine:corrinoid methyltransferase-like protein
MEPREMTLRAGKLLKKRLAAYEKPQMDPALEKNLARYVEDRKRKMKTSLPA